MTNITFKVAPKGEGKTKWLLNIARKYANKYKIYLVCQNGVEYAKFCDKYFAMYQEVCLVHKYEESENITNAVILVDDLFSHVISSTTVEFLRRNCYKMFVTLTGVTSEAENVEEFYEYSQISLFDILEGDTNEG